MNQARYRAYRSYAARAYRWWSPPTCGIATTRPFYGGYTPASPIPAGKVGLWAGSGSATIQYDNFKVLDMGMPKEIDGKWYSTAADTTITGGKLQFGTLDAERLAVRRGFRGGKYVFECDQPLGSSNGNAAGVLLHYQDPENFMGVIFTKGVTNYTPKLVRRKDGDFSTIATGTAFSMSTGDRVRCAIHDDPGNSALQELKVTVNGTLRLTSTAIDDDWPLTRRVAHRATGRVRPPGGARGDMSRAGPPGPPACSSDPEMARI